MSIDSDVYSTMSGHAGLTALVGTKIYPQAIPQGIEMPAVGYAISTETIRDLVGNVLGAQSRVVVQCWSDKITTAKAVADAVVAAFAASYVPYMARDGAFDSEVGLHSEQVEFDWFST